MGKVVKFSEKNVISQQIQRSEKSGLFWAEAKRSKTKQNEALLHLLKQTKRNSHSHSHSYSYSQNKNDCFQDGHGYSHCYGSSQRHRDGQRNSAPTCGGLPVENFVEKLRKTETKLCVIPVQTRKQQPFTQKKGVKGCCFFGLLANNSDFLPLISILPGLPARRFGVWGEAVKPTCRWHVGMSEL